MPLRTDLARLKDRLARLPQPPAVAPPPAPTTAAEDAERPRRLLALPATLAERGGFLESRDWLLGLRAALANRDGLPRPGRDAAENAYRRLMADLTRARGLEAA